MKPLSDKQRAFVAEYLKDCNASQAAIRAGYASKNANVTGPRLLVNVRIKTAIQEGQAALTSERIADAAELREFWTGLVRQDDALMGERLKASELMAKALQMFTIKVETTGGFSMNFFPNGKPGK